MAFSLGGLTAYVKENADQLLVKSIFGDKTVELINSEGTMMSGVKYKEKINLLAVDAIFQDGTGCTRTASGTTTVTQREISVGSIAIVEDLCVDNLNSYYLNQSLKPGYSNQLPSAFEAKYTDAKADKIAAQLETAVWQGDDDSLNENLNKFDGYLKIIDEAGTSIPANTAALISGGAISSGTGITVSNVKAVVNAMWMAQPADIQGYDDIRIFCGWDVFYKFINAFTDQNLFNFAPTGSEVSIENGTVMIPGTNYKLTAVHGLDGTNRLISGRMYNFVAATDMLNEEERWDLIPDQFNDYLRFIARFKFGVQIAFPDQIVSFKLT